MQMSELEIFRCEQSPRAKHPPITIAWRVLVVVIRFRIQLHMLNQGQHLCYTVADLKR